MAAFLGDKGDRKACCLAIGSAGSGVGGFSKYKSARRDHGGCGGARKDAAEEYGLLATRQDINDFMEWSQARKYDWYGSIEVSGKVGKFATVIDGIHDWLSYCKKHRLRPIVYYSGHGNEDGDWVFNDGEITFDDIENWNDAINTGFIVNVISDCCYSGKWCETSAARTKMNVLAASGPDECAIDRIFAQGFFRGSEEHKAVLKDVDARYTQYVGDRCVQYYYS